MNRDESTTLANSMSKQIRVLMITSEWPTLDHPHAVPFLVQQVNFLRRAGVHVDVFPFRGAKRPLNYLRAWKRLRQKLIEQSYDLIHAQFGQSALLTWPKRLPLVVTFRGCDLQGVRRANGRLTMAGLILQYLCRIVAVRAQAVILVSRRMRHFIPAVVRAVVIPTGLDLERIPRMSQAEARQQLGLKDTCPLILFVGNPADTVKRYKLAESAVTILNQVYPAKMIVGWGRPRRDILLLMNACDALVLTSIQEGSPNVIKEALACDLPVVSVDVGDVAEHIESISGCEICPDNRPETIAACLERVLRRGRRINGWDSVQQLDERILTQKIVQIYHSVLANRSIRRVQEKLSHGTDHFCV